MTRDRFMVHERQRIRFEQFQKDCEEAMSIYEEGVGSMSPFLWTFRPGSIVDEIIVYLFTMNGPSVDLTIDDDGEWVKPYQKPRFV